MASASRTTKSTKTETVPKLHNGDHLTVAEFERRYKAMPELKKAELIGGVVYVGSPVTFDEHAEPHFDFITWLGYYRVHTPGVEGGDNATIRLVKGRNRPQPDACLRISPECGGRSKTVKGYLTGSPELTAEIAASSVSYDLHEKLAAYQLNGVREYIVWRIEDVAIDWFVLRGDKYHALRRSPEGWYQSKVFPGLWLDAQALIESNMARVLEVVQQGIASPEHQQFINRLQARKK